MTVTSNGDVSILGNVGGAVDLRTTNATNGDIVIGATSRYSVDNKPSEIVAAGNFINAGTVLSKHGLFISAGGTFSTTEDSTFRMLAGTVSIEASEIKLSDWLQAGSGKVILNTNTPSQVISLGASTSGSFNLLPETLQQIRAYAIVIGSPTNTGGIVVADSFEAPSRHMTLSTGGSITGSGIISGAELTLAAGGGIVRSSQHLVVEVETLTATAGGSSYVQGEKGMKLDGASAAAGVGGFNLWANGDIKLMSGATVEGGTSVSLIATMQDAKISQASKSITISSPVINLETGTESSAHIGAKSRYIQVDSGSAGVSADVNAVAGGKVYVTGGSVTVQNVTGGSTLRHSSKFRAPAGRASPGSACFWQCPE